MRMDRSAAMLGCTACLCVTACSDSGSIELDNTAFQPSEIIDLGTLVTEDLP